MQRSTAIALLAFTAMFAATAGGTLEKHRRAATAKPVAKATEPAVAGQQLHLMFQHEKRGAATAELLPQF